MNDTYSAWKAYLSGTSDEDALDMMTPGDIDEAFSGNIAFGTGGLRGIMGLGTNRMNQYTVTRVTHGLAKTILSHEYPKSVCIAYDTRHNSAEYAQTVCGILSAFGIAVYSFDKPMPTPALSFVIRYLGLGWGVAITASHNPQEYNGYKVYNSHGVQLTDRMASEITEAIGSVGFFEPLPEKQRALQNVIGPEVIAAYREQIISFVKNENAKDASKSLSEFSVVYSALHGTGANAIPEVLRELGFSPVCIQQEPDGAFGGLRTPNPEEPKVYAEAIREAEKCGAKLLFATDPDCDRIGIMVKTEHGFEPLNGNQVGALLIDYLAQTRGVSPGDTVISTIVSGLLGEAVAEDYGLEFVRLLTGFKYIGEYAERLPKGKRFFFGYEESCGFLAGDGVRDKDAVIASALIVQMAEFYDRKGVSLVDRWIELSQTHGYCLEELHSANISPERQKEIMNRLRDGIGIDNLIGIDDYLPGLNGLPPSDVLKLYFDDGSWAAIRPSGTEPKIKLYVGSRANTFDEAKISLKALASKLSGSVGMS